MTMKNIAGQPVRDNNFFDRPVLSRQFQQKIKSGSSILISAPRRVGKTSLMLHIHDQGMEGYYFIYLITESVNNENEYFKRILNKIFDTEFLTPLQKFSKRASQVLKDRAARVREIGKTIKFDSETTLSFRDEFIQIIKSIDLEGQRLILMIDEFSQTIENIIEDEGRNSAIRFLQCNRELRQDPGINQKIQNGISHSENITGEEIFNLGQKLDVTGTYKDIVNSLVYDGYINNNDDPQVYRFNSPLLKMWWRKNVAN